MLQESTADNAGAMIVELIEQKFCDDGHTTSRRRRPIPSLHFLPEVRQIGQQ